MKTRFLIRMTARKLTANTRSSKAIQIAVDLREEAPEEVIEEILSVAGR